MENAINVTFDRKGKEVEMVSIPKSKLKALNSDFFRATLIMSVILGPVLGVTCGVLIFVSQQANVTFSTTPKVSLSICGRDLPYKGLKGLKALWE